MFFIVVVTWKNSGPLYNVYSNLNFYFIVWKKAGIETDDIFIFFPSTTNEYKKTTNSIKDFELDSISSEEELVFQSKTKPDLTPTIPPILKVYLKNITVKVGQIARLLCPSLKDVEKNSKVFSSNQRPLNKVSFQNRDIIFDDNISIKTVNFYYLSLKKWKLF